MQKEKKEITIWVSVCVLFGIAIIFNSIILFGTVKAVERLDTQMQTLEEILIP